MASQTPTAPPLSIEDACSLDAPALAERAAMIRRELRPYVREARIHADGLDWECAPEPGLRAKLERWIALERECCPGVDFALREEGGALHVAIRGLDPRGLEALGGPAADHGSRVARIARASGLGLVGALLVCCVVPIGIAALLGAAAAAPLSGLDHPASIAASALAVGAAAWLFERQRARRRAGATPGPGGGC